MIPSLRSSVINDVNQGVVSAEARAAHQASLAMLQEIPTFFRRFSDAFPLVFRRPVTRLVQAHGRRLEEFGIEQR